MEQFVRSEMLLGKESLQKLAMSKVAVVGIGGVGSYIVEALARAGVGKLVLVDGDTVEESNINRQLIATYDTIGKNKVDVAKARILSINPKAEVDAYKIFYTKETGADVILGCDYVVDAIDTVKAKLDLIEQCKNQGIPIISAMGTGNKVDPTRFEVEDIYKTSVCPLCRVMRKGLKERNVTSLRVVYSKEVPMIYHQMEKNDIAKTIGSISFVPAVAGLIIAGEVIKSLTNFMQMKHNVDILAE